MVIFICTKFHKNILDGIKVIEWARFSYEKFKKGHKSVKNVGGVTVLFLCTSSDGGSKDHNPLNKTAMRP